jgi:CRP-like cAMP-binding protein
MAPITTMDIHTVWRQRFKVFRKSMSNDNQENELCDTFMLTAVLPGSEAAAQETVSDSTLLSTNVRLLFNTHALHGLGTAAREALAEKLQSRWFQAGEQLLEQGQLGVGMHILVEGQVKVVIATDGRTETLDVSDTGDILGEMSLLTGVACTATVIAVNDVRTLLLAREDFEELKHQFPELEIALSQLVSDRLGRRSTDALCGKTIGVYVLRRCINRGGMGVVYEATETSGKTVALKMLRHRFVHEPKAIDRFVQEGKTLSEIEHPNLVSVHACFVAFNTRFLSMEYWDGFDLAQLIHQRGSLDEATCRAILGQVASGLKHSHASQVLHLDIKPGNILLTKDGRVALTDFGLCKLIGASEDVNTVVGTLPYMPPEQFEAGQVCEASDWYALACTAVEMLTGKRLFQETSFNSAWQAKSLRVPSSAWPEVEASAELKHVVNAALHPDPTQRTLDLEHISSWAAILPELF